MDTIKELYLNRTEEFTNQLTQIKKRLLILSILRLLIFAIILLSIFYLPGKSILFSVVSGVLSVVIFLLLIKRYLFLTYRKNHLKNLININRNEINALEFRYENFGDGAEFVDHDHPFSFDLDIFGPGSIFQFLNRTCTFDGKRMLSKQLSTVFTNSDEIKNKQNAIKELAPEIDLRQNFQATGQLYSETKADFDDVMKWLSEKDILKNKRIYVFLSWFFPTLSILFIGLCFVNIRNISYLILLFLIQLFFVGMHLIKTNRTQALIGKKFELLKKIHRLLAFIEKGNFKSEILHNMQERLNSQNISAHSAINKLSKIVSAFDNRLNLIAGMFLNGLAVWDIQCILRIEKWKKDYRDKIPDWFEIIGEFDAFCCMANFSFNHPGYCYAEPVKDLIIDIRNGGHPLIPDKERVCNDITISKKGDNIIITGANMAGKSTFLRTVALNLVLASNGLCVCADRMRFKPVELFTSMRTSDSLSKNESYFYAELKRLKELITELKTGKELFIVLDEILKGTNSTDKQKGSKEVLKLIIELGGSGLIATHDLDLAQLEKEFPDHLTNKCFEIEIKGAEIFFDYKLYDGITKKMNATLLMKQMGIIPSEN